MADNTIAKRRRTNDNRLSIEHITYSFSNTIQPKQNMCSGNKMVLVMKSLRKCSRCCSQQPLIQMLENKL